MAGKALGLALRAHGPRRTNDATAAAPGPGERAATPDAQGTAANEGTAPGRAGTEEALWMEIINANTTTNRKPEELTHEPTNQ